MRIQSPRLERNWRSAQPAVSAWTASRSFNPAEASALSASRSALAGHIIVALAGRHQRRQANPCALLGRIQFETLTERPPLGIAVREASFRAAGQEQFGGGHYERSLLELKDSSQAAPSAGLRERAAVDRRIESRMSEVPGT